MAPECGSLTYLRQPYFLQNSICSLCHVNEFLEQHKENMTESPRSGSHTSYAAHFLRESFLTTSHDAPESNQPFPYLTHSTSNRFLVHEGNRKEMSSSLHPKVSASSTPRYLHNTSLFQLVSAHSIQIRNECPSTYIFTERKHIEKATSEQNLIKLMKSTFT